MGTAIACRAAFADLADGGGAIVTFASVDGLGGHAARANYCASKFAVIGLTQTLAIEWGSRGSRVNAVAPTVVITPRVALALPDDFLTGVVVDRTPLGRLGEAQEVVSAVMFLLSPQAGFITGAVLPVDGGLMAGHFTRDSGRDLQLRWPGRRAGALPARRVPVRTVRERMRPMATFYARKGLLGVMTPQANTTVEPETALLLPDGFGMIAARLTSGCADMNDRLIDYFAQIEETAAQFANAPVDAIGFACTGASYFVGPEAEAGTVARIEAARGIPLITAGRAITHLAQPCEMHDCDRFVFRKSRIQRVTIQQIALNEGAKLHRTGPACNEAVKSHR